MTRADWRLLWRHMRAPVFSFVALLLLLGLNVALGATLPFRGAGYLEAAVVIVMVLTVLLVSMQVTQEPPVIKLFAGLGFFWLLIMFGMTLVDYLSR